MTTNDLFLQGNVRIVQGTRKVNANSVVYNTVTAKAHAQGNVIVQFPGQLHRGLATPKPLKVPEESADETGVRHGRPGEAFARRSRPDGLADRALNPSLFESRNSMPLAARMRPRTFDEFVGTRRSLGPGRALRRAVESDAVPSMILWGPPGCGKTTLAEIVARSTGSYFERISAVSAGVADLRRIVAESRTRLLAGRRSVLFIDEIHRFNKAQQDAVLPYVEDGTVTLIGATTENPSFEVNSALLSRARVFVLTQLSDAQVEVVVDRALTDSERGLGELQARLEDDARATLVGLANGDARTALNALEFAVASTPERDGHRTVTSEIVREAMQRRGTAYDKGGDAHYDTISAFIKSIRASDPDAATYWLARMLDGGEDPSFVARRLVILASEDVGLADSRGLQVAVAAQQAAHFVGMPEAFYPLAHATLYLATAPKSNSVGRAYRRGDGRRARDAQRAGAAASAQRADRTHARPGLRPRLSLRARRLRRRAGEPPREPGRHDVLPPGDRGDERRVAGGQKKGGPSSTRTAPFPLLLLGVMRWSFAREL